MGTSESSTNWEEDYEPVDPSTTGNRIKVRHRSQHHDTFDLISIFIDDEGEREVLEQRLKERQKKELKYILPLLKANHKKEDSFCGQYQKYYLIYPEAEPSLQQFITYRRLKNQHFSCDQILYIIRNVTKGLQELTNIREEYGNVTMENIIVRGQVKLKDSILVNEQQKQNMGAVYGSGSKTMKGFPSPQKLHCYYDTLTQFQQKPADLFSLGIIGLQLYHPKHQLKSIYINKNPIYQNSRIDYQQIKMLCSNIQEYQLRQAIQILTDLQPQIRMGIYHLVDGFHIDNQKLKMFKQNPIQIKKEDLLIEPIKSLTPVKQPQKTVNVQSHSPPIGFQTSKQVNYQQLPQQPQLVTYFPPPPSNNQRVVFSQSSAYLNLESPKPINTFDTFGILPQQTITFSTFPQFVKPQISITPHSETVMHHHKEHSFGKQLQPQSPIMVFDKLQTKYAQSSYQLPQIRAVSVTNYPTNSTISQMPTSKPETTTTSKVLNNPIINNLTDEPIKQEHIQIHIEPTNNQYHSSTKLEKDCIHVITEIPDLQNSTHSHFNHQLEYAIQEYEIGTKYEGYKLNGKRNGRGKFYYKQGSHYDGEWKDNRMHGFGVLYYPDGSIAYEGQWKNDQFDGRGIIYNDSKVTINGQFDYTDFNKLTDEWVSYEGELRHDIREGVGKLTLTNGQYYEGQFEGDFVHGMGTFTRTNGTKLKGQWSGSYLKKIVV